MPAWNSIESVVTGRVRSVNEKGLKLEGHDDWLNVSKYAVGVVLPERGAAVACTLDKAGFLRAVDVVDALPVAGGSDHAPPLPAAPTRGTARSRGWLILKAAAEFGAARPNLKSGRRARHRRVLGTLDQPRRGADPTTDDLTDAF